MSAMPDAPVVELDAPQPSGLERALSEGQQREFARRAELFGHSVAELERGAEVVTFTRMPTVPSVRALVLASEEQRRRRQAVFFSPQIEQRQSIGQGVHDRLEAFVWAAGEMEPIDVERASLHLPFPTRLLSIRNKSLGDGESWDVSVRGEHWELDDRDDVISVVNIGELRIGPGANVLVRGNLLILAIQRLICEPRDLVSPYHLAILPTPFSVDPRIGPLHGPPGGPGRSGSDGADGVPAETRQTLLGPQLAAPPRPGEGDGCSGGDGTSGEPGGRARTGGATKIAEIMIRELEGSLSLLAAGGAGGDGGRGGDGGAGGSGGRGAPGVRALGAEVPGGNGGRGGRGGDGGDGGRGGNGGICSNIFVSVPHGLEHRIDVLAQAAHGGAGGAGGAGGTGGAGGAAGAAGASAGPAAGVEGRAGERGAPGAHGRDAKGGRTRPAPPVYVNEVRADARDVAMAIAEPAQVVSNDRRQPRTAAPRRT
jgi:hypothetical protein